MTAATNVAINVAPAVLARNLSIDRLYLRPCVSSIHVPPALRCEEGGVDSVANVCSCILVTVYTVYLSYFRQLRCFTTFFSGICIIQEHGEMKGTKLLFLYYVCEAGNPFRLHHSKNEKIT